MTACFLLEGPGEDDGSFCLAAGPKSRTSPKSWERRSCKREMLQTIQRLRSAVSLGKEAEVGSVGKRMGRASERQRQQQHQQRVKGHARGAVLQWQEKRGSPQSARRCATAAKAAACRSFALSRS